MIADNLLQKLTLIMTRALPSLNALRAFEIAARHESMSRAAQELHVTHGAISRQIRVLESQLETPLFVRLGRGLSLTPAGQRLRDAATSAFSQLTEACDALLRDNEHAPFVLGCPGSLLARWVIPHLEQLQHDLPNLPIHLSAQEAPARDDLGRLDALLLLDAPPWPDGWQVTTLAPERIGPVLSPRYGGWPALRGQPAEALLHETVLHTRSRPQAWTDWTQAVDLPEAPMPAEQDFAHLYPMLEAAIAGLGIAIAPAPLVADELQAGRLLAPWGFVATQASWVLATTTRRETDQRVRMLAHWLRGALDGG